MALRDQPYVPLYVKDVLTDEKLIECSASSHGVYFRLICILHKQETYGKLNLKAKYKQNESNVKGFSLMLEKSMPFDADIIFDSITELAEEGVLTISDCCLQQKRMVRDGELSEVRAKAGSEGGKKGRNSGLKRYYNEKGYLYLIYDKDDTHAFKIGISKEPSKRIKGIIRKTGRENLMFRRQWEVDDMGEKEQEVLDYFDDIRDGEWIYGEFNIVEIEESINLILNESKIKANSANANANTNENTNAIKSFKEGRGVMNIIQKYYYDKYFEVMKVKYVADFGKDGKIFKNLASVLTEEELKKCIGEFLNSNDEFVLKAGYTVGVFRTQVNKIVNNINSLANKHGSKSISNAGKLKQWIEKDSQ